MTALESAAAAHVSGKRFAKPVLLRDLVGSRFVLAVLPATELIDLERLGQSLGFPVALATEDEWFKLFPDCEPGAAPPFGTLVAVPVIADAHLALAQWIAVPGGTHTDLIEMAWKDFQRIARPAIIDYGRPRAEISSEEGLWPP
jgi:Ala-tRNA(Pro) deacylase